MSWKDYFYFQKGDRVAVVLLLVLISLSGGTYLVLQHLKQARLGVGEASFTPKPTDSLQHRTAYKQPTDSSAYTTSPRQNITNYPYPYQPKLRKGQTIELNRADTAELKKIPGIGSAYSKRIVKYRDLLGGYAYKEQLKEVWGMDDDLFEKISPFIIIKSSPLKIAVNTAQRSELSKHPYISYRQSIIIERIRKQSGNVESIDALRLYDEFTDEDLEKLTHYLSFD